MPCKSRSKFLFFISLRLFSINDLDKFSFLGPISILVLFCIELEHQIYKSDKARFFIKIHRGRKWRKALFLNEDFGRYLERSIVAFFDYIYLTKAKYLHTLAKTVFVCVKFKYLVITRHIEHRTPCYFLSFSYTYEFCRGVVTTFYQVGCQ